MTSLFKFDEFSKTFGELDYIFLNHISLTIGPNIVLLNSLQNGTRNCATSILRGYICTYLIVLKRLYEFLLFNGGYFGSKAFCKISVSILELLVDSPKLNVEFDRSLILALYTI